MCWKATIFPISRYIYYFSQTQQKYKCRSLQFILLQLQLLECVLQTYYIESWTDYIILLCSWAQASTAEYGSQVAKEHRPNSQVQNWHKPFKQSPKIHTKGGWGLREHKNAPIPKLASQNLHWPQIPTMLHICTTASQIRTPLHYIRTTLNQIRTAPHLNPHQTKESALTKSRQNCPTLQSGSWLYPLWFLGLIIEVELTSIIHVPKTLWAASIIKHQYLAFAY